MNQREPEQTDPFYDQRENSAIDTLKAVAALLCAGLVCAELFSYHDINLMSCSCYTDMKASAKIQLCMILFFMSLLAAGRKIPYRELFKAFAVWIPAIFFVFVPSLFLLPAVVFCTGVSSYRFFTLTARYCGKGSGHAGLLPDDDSPVWFRIALLAVIAAVVAAYMISKAALNGMLLCFSDWGIFAEVADNTLKGHFMFSFWQRERCFLSDHFMPSFYLLFLPVWYCFPYPETVFALGAIFLFGSGLLLYRYCRNRGGCRMEAALATLIYLTLPSLSTMNLAVFYGFHVIYFFIPVYLLFAMLKDSGHKKWAFFIFLFSLGIKETVPLIWIGWSVIFLLAGEIHWKQAMLYGLTALVWEFFVLKLAIPYFAPGKEENLYFSQFAHLGISYGDIILSPFLRPGNFWGTLFRGRNILLVLLILIPLFPLVIRKPLLIPAAFPALAVSMLRGNPELNSIYLHHQTEALVILTVISFSALYDEKSMFLPAETREKRKLLLWTTLLCAAVSHFLWGQSLLARENVSYLFRLEDCTAASDRIRAMIPEGAEISATERTAAWLLGRNRIFSWEKSKEYLLLDASDNFVQSDKIKIANILIKGRYRIIREEVTGKHHFILYRRGVLKNPAEKKNR